MLSRDIIVELVTPGVQTKYFPKVFQESLLYYENEKMQANKPNRQDYGDLDRD